MHTQSWKAPTCRNFSLRIQIWMNPRKILCGVSSQGNVMLSLTIPKKLVAAFQPWLPPSPFPHIRCHTLDYMGQHPFLTIPCVPEMMYPLSPYVLILKDTNLPPLLERLPIHNCFYFLDSGDRIGLFGWDFFFVFNHALPTLGNHHRYVILPTGIWTSLESPCIMTVTEMQAPTG